MELIRQSEGEGECSGGADDFKWSQILFGKLLQWSGSAEIFCFYVDMVADLQGGGWQSALVHILLIASLSL